MKLEKLYLWCLVDPLAPAYVGEMTLTQAGKGVGLQYGPEWIASGFPLSEDLPLTGGVFLPPNRMASQTPMAVGAVDDARPDRWGEKVIRFLDRPQRTSLMEYLYYAGDDRFGALGVSTSKDRYTPRAKGPLPRLEQAQTLSEVVEKIQAAEPLSETERRIIANGGSPLGGAKPKALIEIAGQQWVIKFFNNEPVDAPLIEHATMTLAIKAGINACETMPIRLQASHAVAIKRFDRIGDARLHCISAGTAIRASGGEHALMGYPELALIIRRRGIRNASGANADAQELFRRMVFNILVDNTDDHEKNHALIIANPRENGAIRLSPAYDVLPTNSGQGFQEFVCGDLGQESSLENAMTQHEVFGLSKDEAATVVRQVIDCVDGWTDHFRKAGVSERDIEMLSDRIDGPELFAQRRQFSSMFPAHKS